MTPTSRGPTRSVSVPGAWAVVAGTVCVAAAGATVGMFAVGTAVVALAAAQSLLLVRSLERRGDELRLRYVGPRRRTIPLARVAGVTGELGIWLTRIELRDGYPVVLAGRPPGVPDLVT